MLDKIFSPEMAVKVFYAFLAVHAGDAAVTAVKPQSGDLVAYRLAAIEKKIDSLEATVSKQVAIESLINKHIAAGKE